MGIYKNLTAVYGKNEKGRRVQIGIKVNDIFYKGISKTSEIPKQKAVVSTPKATTTAKKGLFGKKKN